MQKSTGLRIALLENIHPVAQKKLQDEGFQVSALAHSPTEAELIPYLKDFDVVGIRSKTELTTKVLQSNPHLMAIGAFCIGTNQIQLETANALGIPVFNAPHSNTRSVAELVIAELVILSRQLGDRNNLAHEGGWIKSADGSREIRGKTLGIIGYGHISSQVSVLAEAMGLSVLFYDVIKKLPLGNAKVCSSLRELLELSDFVTLHVPETPQTKDMISKTELLQMKKGSFLINASRGSVVVIEDLAQALREKHIAGCAVDVFPMEPASNKEKFVTSLQKINNVFLTPHIGGSTEEAQYSIGLEVAESFRRYVKVGSTSGAVNFPQVDLPKKVGAQRILNVHRNEPGVLGEINGAASRFQANIQAQFLATDSKIGYIVMDVEKDDVSGLVSEIESLKRSIKTRVIG